MAKEWTGIPAKPLICQVGWSTSREMGKNSRGPRQQQRAMMTWNRLLSIKDIERLFPLLAVYPRRQHTLVHGCCERRARREFVKLTTIL